MTPEQTDELLSLADDMIRAEVKPQPWLTPEQAHYTAIACETMRDEDAQAA